jgi:hypothetical protein
MTTSLGTGGVRTNETRGYTDRPMRTALALGVVALTLLVIGCGDDEPERSALATELAALCEQARLDVESLGLPAEVGIAVVQPWAKRGKRLAASVGKLEGTTEREREQVASLSKYLAEYYAGLNLAFLVYRDTKNAEGYAIAVDRAEPFLTSAERLATRIGAPECAVRPFADYTPES